MNTVQEIQAAIARLNTAERKEIAIWADAMTHSGYRVEEAAVAYHVEPELPYMSVEEYLEFELNSDLRHEYVNGTVYAMTGASMKHNIIVGNLFAALHSHVRSGPCRAYITDLKLRLEIDRNDAFYYPDVMVACTRDGEAEHWLRNPTLIVEVLSPSTESIDRREKFFNYTQIPSVEEYLLIAQDQYKLRIHRRRDGWAPECILGADGIAELRSLGFSLPLAELYRGVPD